MKAVMTMDQPLEFKAGDRVVVLYEGLYHGIYGRFLGLREDATWADIEEQTGTIRSHPVAWLRRPEDLDGHGQSLGEILKG